MRILINASNLNGGGAVQVATSFLVELVILDIAYKYDVLLSPVVYDNFISLGFDLKRFNSFTVEANYGLRFLFSKNQQKLGRYDLVFTIFGPLYTIKKPNISLMGFAQPNIIYPKVGISLYKGFFNKFLFFFKYSVQKIFFWRSDMLIVELEHVRKSLQDLFLFSRRDICIVKNAVNSFYLNSGRVNSIVGNKIYKIGLLSRYYPHKNFEILNSVVKILIDKYMFVDFEFHLTIDDTNFSKLGFNDSRHFVNHGPLRVDQCLDFYNLINCVFFPSLLECFSASPLEALIMGKTLVASDRDFVRDTVGDFAIYFDPKSPESAAAAIFEAINSKNDYNYFELARVHASSFSSPSERACSYSEIIDNLLRD